MAIEQIGGGANINYTSQVESAKLNSNTTTVNTKEAQKPAVNENNGVQDKVEIKQQTNTSNVPTEAEKVKDNAKAEALKESIKKQMEQNPMQSVYAQATNITPARVANLL